MKGWFNQVSFISLWTILGILVVGLILAGTGLYTITLNEKSQGFGSDGKNILLSPPELELHYKFDSLSGNSVEDFSDNGFDGIVYGDTSAVEGVIGNSFKFDGNGDYISSTNINLGKTFSVSTWIKLNNYPTNIYMIASKGVRDDVNFHPYTFQLNSEGYVSFFFRGANLLDAEGITSTSKLQLNKWYLVTATYNNGDYKIYLNDNLEKSRVLSSQLEPYNNQGELFIGSVKNVVMNKTEASLNGTLDDFRIYYIALNNWEIEGMYKTTLRDLQAHYNFERIDENGKAKDESENRYDAVQFGNPEVVKGIDLNAINFDGNDYLKASTSSLSENRLSITAWVNPEEIEGRDYRTIASTYTNFQTTQGGYGFRLIGDESSEDIGRLQFFYWPIGGESYQTFKSNKVIPVDSWSQVGVTFDGSDVRLYVDGKLDSTHTSSREIKQQNDLYIGAMNFSTDGIVNYWKGKIDNLKVYDKVISEGDIRSEFDSINLIVYHKFDSITSDNQVRDSSTHGFDGEVFNAKEDEYGIKDDAVAFDGKNDYIEIADSQRLDLASGSFTISLWFKSLSSNLTQTMFEKKNFYNLNDSYYNLILDDEGIVEFNSRCNSTISVKSENSVLPNKWNNVVVVREGNRDRILLYLNGELDITSTDRGCDDLSNSMPLTLGGQSDIENDDDFNGLLDEFKMYSRAMNSAEIEDLYDDVAPSNDTDDGNNNNNQQTCTPDWSCTWSECANGIQQNVCEDLNSCGTNTGKPAENERTCSSGSSDFGSSDSSSDSGDSLDTSSSSSISASKLIFYFLIAILLVGIVVIGVVLFIKHKNNQAEQAGNI
ncbi:hypothetical protein COU60_00225 [Candidatus Pacearchaeota archaeon CG10_big_fil_rev_8_21_14_0_10_34_76]|nr:MAG: hypothetical protein COU60_00225 [Candidatus Pacearchaeota archaeon CG10_big_fil_rev_8_21_14_0_10_34_76]